jgi:tetratricopeptide (TPR) repeat protein
MLLPLGFYFYLRAHALTAYSAASADGLGRVTDMAARYEVADLDTVWLLLANWGVGLKLMVWPHPLQLHYPPPSTAIAVFLIFMQVALLLLGLAQLRRGRGPLLAALAWFYLALLPASRIVAPGQTDPHLAERYLYFASVGPAIALAFALAWLGSRLAPRGVAALVLLALLILMPLTWIRNNDWVTDVRLFEAEYRRSGPEKDTLRLLTGAHAARGNYARGEEICDRHADMLGEAQRFALHCGMIYAQRGRFDDAEHAYLAVTEEGDHRASAHSNLALLYLKQGRFAEAVLQFEHAIEKEPSPAVKAMRRGIQLANLYPRDPAMLARARDHFNEAYRIQPMLGAARNLALRMDEMLSTMEQR